MGKIEEVVRSEIARLAKKAIKGTLESIVKDLRELKRNTSELSKTVAALEKKMARHARHAAPGGGVLEAPADELKSARLTPRLIKKLRKRLGITQSDLALLLTVSKGAIVSWESGRSAPRQANRSGMVALRKLGRRDVKKVLAERGKVKSTRKKASRKRRGRK